MGSELSAESKVEYILLQPEYVDACASGAVMTAREDPRGIGHILEATYTSGAQIRESLDRRDASKRRLGDRVRRKLPPL